VGKIQDDGTGSKIRCSSGVEMGTVLYLDEDISD
jgi:hypothetical protein